MVGCRENVDAVLRCGCERSQYLANGCQPSRKVNPRRTWYGGNAEACTQTAAGDMIFMDTTDCCSRAVQEREQFVRQSGQLRIWGAIHYRKQYNIMYPLKKLLGSRVAAPGTGGTSAPPPAPCTLGPCMKSRHV